MRSPFPGMNPYLEHPSLWPDVHNRLIAAIADDLSPRLAPKYYVRLERRTYLMTPDDMTFIDRPDLAVLPSPSTESEARRSLPRAAMGVVEVLLAVPDEVSESYLEVHETTTGRIVTVMANEHTETVTATVPLADMLKYAPSLNSITGGRGSYVMEYAHYDEVPRELAVRIVEEHRAGRQAVGAH